MAARVLIIEDDPSIGKLLRRALVLEGYEVEWATTGPEGLRLFEQTTPDLVILDLMLPGMDGIEVCRRMRETSQVPILMLTARDAVEDRVLGLDSGADDYVVKPFDVDELLARLRAHLRRSQQTQTTRQVLRFADLVVDTASRSVRRGNREIELTAREFDLLLLFMRHPNQVLTRSQIYDEIWSYDFGGESNIIEVYIRYLRTKLEAGGEPRLIHTKRGVGYILHE
ncbi:MAG: response regulator transcription factor [Caldilineales bacterium]|nr:response regulator transcription factor [Caldilineales bacterium]